MAKQGGARLEIWGLVALFGLFAASSFYFEQVAQETGVQAEPSSLTPKSEGVKALYLLYRQLSFRVDQLRQPWSRLTSSAGLALIIEPQSRQPTEDEIEPLRHWIEAGGTALLVVSAPARGLDEKDSIAGDLEIVAAKKEEDSTVSPALPGSPYTRDVQRLSVQSPVRLKPEPNSSYQTLFQDKQGIVALHKPLGKGHVLIVADDKLASNTGIKEEDNVLFLNSIAREAVGNSHRLIVFDEYHHGVGFEHQAGDKSGGLLANMPIPLRLGLWHLLGLAGLLLYNGNRRFGQPRAVSQERYRLRADFVHSMGLLLRRAGASDIALLTLYQSFLRDIRRSFDLAPEEPVGQIVAAAVRRKYANTQALQQLLLRCEEIAAGTRIQEPEMLSLTQKLDQFRRDFDLVGH